MCRTEQDIRATDIVCLELQDYIDEEKKKLEKKGNGKIHFSILQARTSIKSRVWAIQMKEDMMDRFDTAEQARETSEANVAKVTATLDAHLKDCIKNPAIGKLIKENPGGIISRFTIVFLVYFVVFNVISEWVGFSALVDKLITLIAGI